jgi:hypothetical protein
MPDAKTLGKCCLKCTHVWLPDAFDDKTITGACRRFPPYLDPHHAGTSTFPTVHLERFLCGEFKRRADA